MLITNAMLTLSEGKTVTETFLLLRTYDIVIVSESGAQEPLLQAFRALKTARAEPQAVGFSASTANFRARA